MSAPPVRVKREEPDGGAADERISRDEQEEALVALIEHRTKEVEHLRQRMTYYKSQLDQAQKRLDDSQTKLARLRGRSSVISSNRSQVDHPKGVQAQQKLTSPRQMHESPSRNQPQSRPQLIIPAANPKVSQPVKMVEAGTHASTVSQARMSVPSHTNSTSKLKGDRSTGTSNDKEASETPNRGIKRKFEQKEHKELIPLIRSSSSPNTIRCQTGSLISSQHKRKLRSLELCPTNDRLFVTSALDGVINLWETRGSSANLLTSTDSLSPKQRRWAEDIAWHPEGHSLFAVYTADGGDSQISILDLNQKKSGTRVKFLEERPHVKGIINNIVFMPWDDVCFVTGGSDHAVVLWTEKDGENMWKPKALHRNLHSSAVMGVAGMQHKQIILSAGADKRIIGYNLEVGRADYKHQIESKCMSILPNPSDFNLFMVQTGTPERQLRLFDIRLRQTELHSFGFKQESSESQSALINQAWSPDGMYITSGSVDPIIHIFDIRYNGHKPSQSIKAHQKRVFKAVWHHSLPLMISISSDLNIGLHRMN